MRGERTKSRMVLTVMWTAVLATSLTGAAAEPTRLRLSAATPVDGSIGAGLTSFAAEVRHASGGAVVIDLLADRDAIRDDLVASHLTGGSIDLAAFDPGVLTPDVPAVDFLDYPFLLNFTAIVAAATDPDRPLRPILDAAILRGRNIRPLLYMSSGLNVLFARGHDAASPDRIAGRRIRTYALSSAHFIKACGGVPSVTPAATMRDLLASGQIDLVMAGLSSLETHGLWQVADTITRTESAPVTIVVAISERRWQTLPAAAQDALTAAAGRIETALRAAQAAEEARLYDLARAKGLRIVDPRPDQVADWRACSYPVAETIMERAGDLGLALMTAYGRLRTDPCCTTPPIRAGSDGSGN